MESTTDFPLQPSTQPFKTIEVKRLTIKTVSLCRQQPLALLVTYDQLVILDTDYNQIISRMRRLSNIRSALLSLSGSIILAYFSDNTLRLIDVKTGRDIGQLLGVPNNPRMFVFSDKANRAIGGDNQTLSLWKISDSSLEIYSRNWRNLNCYAINSDGSYFALGTFNGQIYVLGIIGENKCSQIQYNKHDKCVMIMAWSENKLLSVSFDNVLLIFEFNDNPEMSQEKIMSFKRFSLGFLPREIKVLDGKYFLSGVKGLYWFTTTKLIGFSEDAWYAGKDPTGELQMVRYRAGELSFFKIKEKYKEESPTTIETTQSQ